MAKNFDPKADLEKNPSLRARWDARSDNENKKSLDSINKSLTSLVKAITPNKNKSEEKPPVYNSNGLNRVASFAGKTANSLLMASSPAGYLVGKVYSMLKDAKDMRSSTPKQTFDKPESDGALLPKSLIQKLDGALLPKSLIQKLEGALSPKPLIQKPDGALSPKPLIQKSDGALLPKPLIQKLDAYLDFQGGNLKQRAKFEKYYANHLEKTEKLNKEKLKKTLDDNKKSLSELTKITTLIKPIGLAVLGIGAATLLGVTLLKRFFQSESVSLSDKDVKDWTTSAPTEGKRNLYGTRVSSAFGSLRVGSGASFQDNVSLETAKKGGARPHLGMDVAYTRRYDKAGNPIAIPVYSPVDGKIVVAVSNQTESKTGFGNYVKIQETASSTTNITYVTLAHLETVTVKVGDVVKKGDKVGTVGSTGASTGLHLHVQREIQTASGSTVYTDPASMYTNWYGEVASVSGLTSDQVENIKKGDVQPYRNRRIASIPESQLNRLKGGSSVSKNDTKISDQERVAIEKEKRDKELEQRRQEASSKPPQVVIQQPATKVAEPSPPMAYASMNADLEVLSRNSKGVAINY